MKVKISKCVQTLRSRYLRNRNMKLRILYFKLKSTQITRNTRICRNKIISPSAFEIGDSTVINNIEKIYVTYLITMLTFTYLLSSLFRISKWTQFCEARNSIRKFHSSLLYTG